MGSIVDTRSGKVEGVIEDELEIFRGIPFASPPVGPLRFAAPAPEQPWQGVRAAAEFGPSALQQPMMLPLPGMQVGPMDEDCLYLNVYTPATDAAHRPVMVWIHGGGFVIGSGSQALYDGAPLSARGDVVVVTVNYRLGPLGFLYLADLCPDLEGAVGNAGILDQVAALEWVRDNIERFGGDPGNVTIFGESAGGMSVGTLLGMPSANGLFQRAILQSGAAHNIHSRETATEVAKHFVEVLGVDPADSAALRDIPPDKLLDTQQQTMLKLGTRLGLLPFQPLVDDATLPEPPLDVVRAGGSADIDLLLGSTRDEWKLFGFLDQGLATLDDAGLVSRLEAQLPDEQTARRIVDTYRSARESSASTEPKDLFFAIETDRIFRIPALRLADAQQQHQSNVFLYHFTWESPLMGGALGACHAIELPFVFGVLHKDGAEVFAGSGPDADGLSEKLMDAWIAFARSGDPSHPGLPGGRWDRYDSQKRATMVLGRECGMDHDLGGAEREAWDGLL